MERKGSEIMRGRERERNSCVRMSRLGKDYYNRSLLLPIGWRSARDERDGGGEGGWGVSPTSRFSTHDLEEKKLHQGKIRDYLWEPWKLLAQRARDYWELKTTSTDFAAGESDKTGTEFNKNWLNLNDEWMNEWIMNIFKMAGVMLIGLLTIISNLQNE